MLDRIDLTPAALRADLTGSRVAPQRLYATVEVISRATDLCCESAQLVHDNERRWRVTRERTEQLVPAMIAHTGDPKTADTGTADSGKASGGGEGKSAA